MTKPPTAGTPAGPPAAGTLSPVAVIGGGMMGEAIVAGWVSRGVFAAAEISVVDPAPARREALASLGVKVFTQAKEALPGAATVLLAVKPQVIDAVAAEIAPALGSALVISIAAGVTTARLESLLAAGTSVVRVMPNLPMSAGQGMAIISGGAVATDSQVTGARNLFEALGDAVAVDECHQNAATSISGSGPAYFALVVDALARSGVSVGLSRDVAERLAVQTMRGTAELLGSSHMHPEALVDAVSSPGGTTIAAISKLESHGVRAAFADAVRAATWRAEELGSK